MYEIPECERHARRRQSELYLLSRPVTSRQGTLQHGTATYPMLAPILGSERENPEIQLESTRGHLLQRDTHTEVAVQTGPQLGAAAITLMDFRWSLRTDVL